MMKVNEFAEYVLSAIRNKANGNFNAWINTIKKNNGIPYMGITISQGEMKIQPIVYLNKYYDAFINNKISLEEAVNIIYKVILEHLNYVPGIKITDLTDWELIKTRICVKLINAKQNVDLLESIPHRLFLDFAIVYYIKININEDGMQYITVQNKFLDIWEISEDELYKIGLNNLETSEHILFKDIREILPSEMVTKDDSPLSMYVLSNESGRYGATVLLLKNELLKISQRLGKMIILPSSLHEVIVLPENQYAKDYELCAEMVRDINATIVPPEDYLSNHVYSYDSTTQELKIIA